ncbi:MAG: peptidoglycan-binding domain-containing protein [Thiobacillaceae bacterium]
MSTDRCKRNCGRKRPDIGWLANLTNQTMAAVDTYQKSKGLSEDGYLTMETVKALGVSPK